MDARRLVGMTMGARKREARREAAGGPGPYKTPDYRRRLARGIGKLIAAQGERVAIDYQKARATYRIGERLRPCLGCFRCNPEPDDCCMACGCDDAGGSCGCDPRPCPGCQRLICGSCCGEEGSCPDCEGHEPSFVADNAEDLCDGTGVLPAKTR